MHEYRNLTKDSSSEEREFHDDRAERFTYEGREVWRDLLPKSKFLFVRTHNDDWRHDIWIHNKVYECYRGVIINK